MKLLLILFSNITPLFLLITSLFNFNLYKNSNELMLVNTTPSIPNTTITPTSSPINTPTPGISYVVNTKTNKDTVKPQEKFEIEITVQNNGSQNINNFEIRIPFLRKINNASFISEKPSFNKILDTLEYPAQFQNRSWIINTFSPGDQKTFTLEFLTSNYNSDENVEISTIFTLPITWIDPNNLESNKEINLNYLRFDIYINKLYKESVRGEFPKYENLNTSISKVKLPEIYTFPGSKTTDLSKIDKSNYTAINNFTLDTKDVTLELIDPIDLSGEEIPQILSNLNDFINLSWGKIELKKEIPFLKGKKIKIIFKNTNFKNPPLIRLKKNTNVLQLSDFNGSYNENETFLELSEILDVALLSDIYTDKSVYETKDENIQITLKVSDPNAAVVYTTSNGSTPVDIIDINTGEFNINFKLNPGENIKVDIIAKLKNNETYVKSIVVKNINIEVNSNKPTEQPNTISMPINQLTIILLSILFVILIIVLLIIYFLVKRKSKKNELEIELKNIVAKSQLEEKDDPHLFPTETIKVNLSNTNTISLFSINNLKNKKNLTKC